MLSGCGMRTGHRVFPFQGKREIATCTQRTTAGFTSSVRRPFPWPDSSRDTQAPPSLDRMQKPCRSPAGEGVGVRSFFQPMASVDPKNDLAPISFPPTEFQARVVI